MKLVVTHIPNHGAVALSVMDCHVQLLSYKIPNSLWMPIFSCSPAGPADVVRVYGEGGCFQHRGLWSLSHPA